MPPANDRAAQASAILMGEMGGEFTIAAENWDAWRVFALCSTQWRMAPMGGHQGLDYPAVESVMRMTGTKSRAETFSKVRLIERGALFRFRGESLRDAIDGI